MKLEVLPVIRDAELASTRGWVHQDGVQVTLDLRSGELHMARHFSWQTLHVPGYRKWLLPVVPRARVANDILAELAPLAERVLAGDEAAATEIEDYLAAVELTPEQRAIAWDALYEEDQAPQVTAEMTDDDLWEMISTYVSEAVSAINIDGWYQYVISERDRLRGLELETLRAKWETQR